MSNVTTPAGKFISYICSSRQGKYESDGNGDDDQAVDGLYGSDRRTFLMVNGMNRSTYHGCNYNISIKGGGDGLISATPRGEVGSKKETNRDRQCLRSKAVEQKADYYNFIAEHDELIKCQRAKVLDE